MINNFLDEKNSSQMISLLQAAELVLEYMGKFQDRKLYSSLLVLEIGKLAVRTRKWKNIDKFSIYISENNKYATLDSKEEEDAKSFESQFNNLRYNPPASSSEEVKKQLDAIVQKGKQKFNQGYYEVNGDKKVPIVTTLPIPSSLKREKETKFNKRRIIVGEILYLIRPIVHCLALIIYGNKSYKPILISLLIDLLRLLIQLKIQLFKKSEKEELLMRLKDLIIAYILRDPFYHEIIKEEILSKVLGSFLSQDRWIYKGIISLIELRSSKSLLL